MPTRPKKSSNDPPAGTGGPDRGEPTRSTEIETKLEIDPDADLPELSGRRKLAQTGIEGVTAPETFELDARYFDTAGQDLLRSKVTLRRRTGGKDAGWHLKLPAGDGARTEVTLPLTGADSSDDAADGTSDLTVPAALSSLVRGTARGRELTPVARVRNRRTVRYLLDGAGRELLEVADDRVDATTIPAGEARRWREVEVEIVGGTRQQLVAAVDLLLAGGARPAASASKLARALGAPDPQPVRKPKSAGAVVAAGLARLRNALLVADRALRAGGRDAVHDARSIVTRLAAALEVFAPVLGPRDLDTVGGQLRDLRVVLDGVRDLSVIRRKLLGQLDDEPEEFATPAARYLKAVLDERDDAAWIEVVRHLDTADYFDLLRALDQVVEHPSRTGLGARAAADELPALIAVAWERLRTDVDAALADPGAATPAALARRSTKVVRYATEAVSGALRPDAVTFAAALETVQETLGEHQDAMAAAALITDLEVLMGTDGRVAFALGRVHAFEQAIAHGALDEAADAWDRVADGDLISALRR